MGDDAMSKRAPMEWDRGGLPPSTYHDEELTGLEKDVLFRRHWQLACHVSDVAQPGDYVAFDMAGARALVLRGDRPPVSRMLARHDAEAAPADQAPAPSSRGARMKATAPAHINGIAARATRVPP